MGAFKMFSSSSFDKPRSVVTNNVTNNYTSKTEPLPNPNPANYKIIKSLQMGYNLLVEINYPDCNNFEGNKILLFKDCQLEDLLKQKLIDPHFSDNKKFKSPFARFEPTKKGWEAGVIMSRILNY